MHINTSRELFKLRRSRQRICINMCAWPLGHRAFRVQQPHAALNTTAQNNTFQCNSFFKTSIFSYVYIHKTILQLKIRTFLNIHFLCMTLYLIAILTFILLILLWQIKYVVDTSDVVLISTLYEETIFNNHSFTNDPYYLFSLFFCTQIRQTNKSQHSVVDTITSATNIWSYYRLLGSLKDLWELNLKNKHICQLQIEIYDSIKV